jgi:tetratricopeptide (TPR) repeat protein
MNTRTRMLAATFAIVILGVATQAGAQGPLAEARALYAAAAYEDALSILGKVDAAAVDRAEAEQYRAFCLIALGRTADAERAIEAVVSADPLFVPRSADVSPRILAMFTDVRRRILPEIARRAYLDGRSAFQAKDFAAASRQFDQVMRLIDQAGVRTAEGMDDLRILVTGFVDLTRAAMDSSSHAGRKADSAIPPAGAGTQDLDPGEAYTAPVAVHQELPPWNPPTAAIAGRAYAGSVRVLIGADGQVQQASVVKPVHPLYDPLVLQAARRWTYRPATRLGEPTKAEKVVEIRLSPR